jgi:signal peptidase II
MSDSRNKGLPLILTAIVIVLDQISKALIVAHVEPGTIGFSALGDFFWVVHERNPAIAFSIGYGLPAEVRSVLFVALPILLMAAIVVYYFKARTLSSLERWAICGILGGGVGNIIDRITRPEGVVDFLSVKFYGLFGLERWPTFNVADSSVVVCGILLVIALIVEDKKAAK